MKTPNQFNEKFLSLLKNYTFNCIDEILKNYRYTKEERNTRDIITNQISRILIKHNLEAIYNCPNSKKYNFTFDVGEADKEFAKYNDTVDSTFMERYYRFVFKHILKKTIVENFWIFYKRIEFNKRIYDLLNGINSEYLTDFEHLFEIFQKINLNNQDMLDVTLYIIITNLNNGILNEEEQSPIMKAHQLIDDKYWGMANLDTSQIDPIIEALEYLNYPNTDGAWAVLSKRIENGKMLHDSKTISVNTPNNKGIVIIDKSLYFEGIERISKYYDIENDLLTKRLSLNEIVYVVGIMQSLNFDDVTLNKFLKTAYKKHKSLSPIDRYLDLSNKIDYYKEIDDVRAIDKTLKEMFREYTLASDDTNKTFWLNSLDEELRSLDKIIDNDYTYELTKNKPQG